MNVREWLRAAGEALAESGCPDPAVDARWIAEDVLGLSPTALSFGTTREISADEAAALKQKLARRVSGEPVQYILESAFFMGLRFYVDGRVLIPRQDTETLVESAVVVLREQRAPKVLDLCTGSGAIGLSIKTLVPQAQVTLTDLSRDALEVARRNARELNVDAEMRHGDLFRAVGRERYDLIASNPPYIPTAEMEGLQREVRREPSMALDGGPDGLSFYRRIAEEAGEHLLPGGSIFLEAGIGESGAVIALLREHIDCEDSGIINDLNGIPRVIWARSVPADAV